MSKLINNFNNIHKHQLSICESVDFTTCPIYYTSESFETSLMDVNEEGSGVLMFHCNTSTSINILKNFITTAYSDVYILEITDNNISIVVDEKLFNPEVILDNPECSVDCKCINCSAELEERNETICKPNCKCINCYSESHATNSLSA